MEIGSVRHKSLKLLMAAKPKAAIKGLSPGEVDKIQRQIAALERVDHPNELRGFPGWKVHELTPGSPGKWALWVTGNYRLTFHLKGNVIHDLDYEDYH